MKKILLFLVLFITNLTAFSQCISGDCVNGYGTFVNDGNKYVGDWVNGYGHGKMNITYNNGDKYIGDYIKGVKNGKGTYTYRDGEIYTGEYVNDEYHGKGTYAFNNIENYIGDFVEGKMQGKGTYTYINGDKYVGDFLNSKKHGKGTYVSNNGDKYVGDFVNGVKQGYGTSTYNDGDKYVGEFFNDMGHGKGTFTFNNGDEYIGTFKEGQIHGKGIYKSNNGTIKYAIYENGKYLGEDIQNKQNNEVTNVSKGGTNNSCVFKFVLPKITWKLVDNRRKCSYCRAQFVPFTKVNLAEAKQIHSVQYLQGKLLKHWEAVNASEEHKQIDRDKLKSLFRKNNYSEIAILNAQMQEMLAPGIKSAINARRAFLDNSLDNFYDFDTIYLYDVQDSKYCSRKCQNDDY